MDINNGQVLLFIKDSALVSSNRSCKMRPLRNKDAKWHYILLPYFWWATIFSACQYTWNSGCSSKTLVSIQNMTSTTQKTGPRIFLSLYRPSAITIATHILSSYSCSIHCFKFMRLWMLNDTNFTVLEETLTHRASSENLKIIALLLDFPLNIK